jgi:hypothetical protein
MEGCKCVCLLKNKLMTYGLVFWDNFYHSSTVFKLQKRIIRIMVGIRDRESCREHFRKLKVLPLQPQYTYLLLLLVINNRQRFKINSDIHSINTRTCTIHGLICQFTRRMHFILGLRYLTDLTVPIKQLSHDTEQFNIKQLSRDTEQFNRALKGFLYLHSFYSFI